MQSTVGTTTEFLSGAVDTLCNKLMIQDTGSLEGKWVFIEMTEGPQFLVQILWQLEMAKRILLIRTFVTLFQNVIMNGDLKEAENSLKLFHVTLSAETLLRCTIALLPAFTNDSALEHASHLAIH